MWVEDTDDPKEGSGDRYDFAMTLHALVLNCDDAGRGVARYGMVYKANYGTDEEYGEGTFHRISRGILVVLPELYDFSNASGMGYDTSRNRVRSDKFDFIKTRRRGVITLHSHMSQGHPTVPKARFIPATPAYVSDVLENLDALSERAKSRYQRPT